MRKKLLISAVGISAVFMMALPSFANTPKTEYTYTYATGGAANTASRAKDKQSDAYMECLSCVNLNTGATTNGGYNGVVYGSSQEQGTFINPVTNAGQGSATYSFTVGTKRNMSNYVYQVYVIEKNNSKAWAKIRGTMTGSTGYIKISGKWAPDV